MEEAEIFSGSSVLHCRPTLKLSRQARVFSYLIVEDAEIFPGKLACDHHGHMKKLLTGENLISQMSNYYEFLSSNSVTSYGLWTSPYLDSWGLGLMLTYAIPITSKVTGKSVHFGHSSLLIRMLQ